MDIEYVGILTIPAVLAFPFAFALVRIHRH